MNRKHEYADPQKARETGNRQNRKYYGRTSYKYPRRPWSAYEDEIILKHENIDRDLSELLKRSQKAIVVRRSRLKSKLVNH